MSEGLGPVPNPNNSGRLFPAFRRPPYIAGNPLDKMHNPSFGFLRLAQADSASAAARYAYNLRVHPDAMEYKHEFLVTVRGLDPASLGQLAVLTRSNELQGIFGQTHLAGSKELGLLVTVPYDLAPDSDVPDEEWCDARGLPVTIIHELTDEYDVVRAYQLETEQAMVDAVEELMPEDTPQMQMYFRACEETTHQMDIHHAQLHHVLRLIGPTYGLELPPAPPAAEA
jgi:hypothetical protein